MNCGMMYTHCAFFQKAGWFSRYDHSLGTALILAHFTHDQRQVIAGLCHDIAAPVFSHTVDFAKGDYLKEESTEDRTEEIIVSDEMLVSLLKKYGLKRGEVSDYHQYPLADNESPKLSSDRLEYTLSNALNYGFAGLDEIREVYDDLIVDENEEGMPEIQFQTEERAEQFEQMMLRCTKIYTADDDRYGMEVLARLIRQMLADHVISEEDLYLDEPSFINRYCKEGKYAPAWRHFTRMTGTRESPDGIIIHAKKRWINPLVRGQGRILDLNQNIRQDVKDYINTSQDTRLKGVYEDGE
jgi:HD superfamily phosphohydrolase